MPSRHFPALGSAHFTETLETLRYFDVAGLTSPTNPSSCALPACWRLLLRFFTLARDFDDPALGVGAGFTPPTKQAVLR